MPGLEDVLFVEFLLWLVRRSARTPVRGRLGRRWPRSWLSEASFSVCCRHSILHRGTETLIISTFGLASEEPPGRPGPRFSGKRVF